MLWFKKKDQLKQLDKLDERIAKELPKNRAAITSQVDDSLKAADKLHTLVEENHFTLRLYSAMGGKTERRKV